MIQITLLNATNNEHVLLKFRNCLTFTKCPKKVPTFIFKIVILCTIYLEPACELNNYLGKLYCVSAYGKSCELISETRKALIALNYCCSLITLNRSLPKISLKREYNVCH